jgi:PHD/YefM family antitoxin component YafN of YafNO toxin-antitoxin module
VTENIQTTDLRRRVREVLDRVRVQRQAVVVYTYDTPQAAIIPYEDYAAYQAWRERQRQRQIWLAELRAIAEDVSARASLSDDEAVALIDEATRKSDS